MESQKKDETIELENGQHGIVLTPEELPPEHMQIDIASVGRDGKRLKTPRISMGDRTLTKEQVYERVKARYDKYKREFPVLIRADFDAPPGLAPPLPRSLRVPSRSGDPGSTTGTDPHPKPSESRPPQPGFTHEQCLGILQSFPKLPQIP